MCAPRPWASKSETAEDAWSRLVRYLENDEGPAAVKAAAAKRSAAGCATRGRAKAASAYISFAPFFGGLAPVFHFYFKASA